MAFSHPLAPDSLFVPTLASRDDAMAAAPSKPSILFHCLCRIFLLQSPAVSFSSSSLSFLPFSFPPLAKFSLSSTLLLHSCPSKPSCPFSPFSTSLERLFLSFLLLLGEESSYIQDSVFIFLIHVIIIIIIS